jgi:hypothetical protein
MLWWFRKNDLNGFLTRFENHIIFNSSLDIFDRFFDKHCVSVFNCQAGALNTLKLSLSKLDKHIQQHVNSNFIIIYENNRVVIILLNQVYSLDCIRLYLEETNPSDYPEYKLINCSKTCKYDIDRIKNCNTHIISEIRNKYHHITYVKSILYLNEVSIFPDKYIHGKPPKIYSIVHDKLNPIHDISITVDPMFKINSIHAYGTHPNFKDGYWCLGKFQDYPLNLNTVTAILENMKIYNLNDCYFIPEFINIKGSSQCS